MATQGRLAVESVSKSYPVREGAVVALSDVTFEVGAGQFVVLIGPSGCGKSTLLHCIGGFVELTDGNIRLDDSDIRGPGPDRGIVFQREALFPWMTVEDNLRAALRPKGLPEAVRRN